MNAKRLWLNLFLLLTVIKLNAQLVAVPDPIFEQALIDRNFDQVLDGFIEQSNVQNYSYLSIPNAGINDLTGIEAFTSLRTLSLSNNNLSTVDLSNNNLLEIVLIRDNNLASITLPNNGSIHTLDLRRNQLTSINISGESNLINLNLSNNNLVDIDLQNNINLEELFVGNNNLNFLDVSSNVNIQWLSFQGNNVTSIDLDNLVNLTLLQCFNNQLSSLNTSSNTSLQAVYAYQNNLTSLNFQENPNISLLNLSNNDLTYLNIQNGSNLLLNYFNVSHNLDLNCIIVDDSNYVGNNWVYNASIVNFTETSCLTPTPAFPFVYPNPVIDNLYVGPANNDVDRYAIHSHSNLIESGSLVNNTIDLSDLSQGYYIIVLYRGKKKISKHIIIKK